MAPLDEARGAASRQAWKAAYGSFSDVRDAELTAFDLESYGEAAWWSGKLDEVPGQHVGLQTDDAQELYRALGFELQPEFWSFVVGRWLDNDANR